MKLDPVVAAIEKARVDGVGIERWQVHGTESRRLSLGIKDREAGNAHAPLSLAEGSSARYMLVWDDGLVCRGTLERQRDPLEAFTEARETAYRDDDAAHVLGPSDFADVKIWDDDTASMAGGHTGVIASRLADVRKKIDAADVRTWSGSFSAGASDSRMVTSSGLDVTSRGTSFGWFVTANGEGGDGYSARRPESDEAFSARLDSLLETAAAIEQDAAPIEAGVHRVLLHPRVVESYVLGTLMQNLDGSAVAHGEGAFDRSAFRVRRAALRKDISLSIDPLLPYHGGSYRFTGFGLPAAPFTYIDGGRLVSPILDVKYANRLEREPTPVPFGHDTVLFGPDTRMPYERALEQGDLMVLSVLGVHTQDRVSGDFSLSAPLALALDGGRTAGRLRGTISGNIWDILRGEDLQFVEVPHETTPGMLFACRFDVAG